MAEVRLENVSKTFGSKSEPVRAVHDLSLTVADGEFVVLVGPSGCGKSTTLRLVAGLEEVSAGRILIGDRVVNNVPPKDRDCAMVFQNFALYPHMTVFGNMSFSLRLRRVPKREIKQKVEHVAGMLGLENLLARKPDQLSGGEQQRVALGRAIVRTPKVFLFDEPLSNLDAKLRRHMRTEIKNLHVQLRTTILYVTHDQEEAMTLGERVVVMNGGSVQQCGSPLEVYNQPANRFVAEFIGTPPMSFLEGRVELDHGRPVFLAKGDATLTPTADWVESLTPFAGKPMTLGIRPEHLRIADLTADTVSDGARAANTIDITVTVAELLGDRMHVYGTTAAGESLIASADPASVVKPKQQLRAKIDMSRVHFFSDGEKVSGREFLGPRSS